MAVFGAQKSGFTQNLSLKKKYQTYLALNFTVFPNLWPFYTGQMRIIRRFLRQSTSGLRYCRLLNLAVIFEFRRSENKITFCKINNNCVLDKKSAVKLPSDSRKLFQTLYIAISGLIVQKL